MFRSIILAARPKTLPAAIVPVWAGCVLAWKLTGIFNLKLVACTLFGAIAIQIATNFFNDAIDSRKGADTETRLGPKRVTASGLMTPRSVLLWGSLFVIVAFGFGIVLYHVRGWPIIALGLPSLFLTYGYTGGPFPLAYRGMGELFVILFFGFVAVTGTVFIQTGEWPREAFLLGGQVGLLSSALISINNLRDIAEDSLTGKRTAAVRFGARFMKYLIGSEITVAALAGTAWIAFGLSPFSFASLSMILIGPIVMKGILSKGQTASLNRSLAVGGGQLLAFALILHAAIVLF
jgi:1,4-dihydroxy-2-naphthoate octaprenyltransferase